MIILLLKLILITSLWCLGIKISTAEDMIFEKLGDWAEKKVKEGNTIFEPLLYCPWCMPSIHTSIGYGFAILLGIITEFKFEYLIMYPLVVMGASVIVGLTWTIIETLIEVKEYFKYINKSE